MTERITFAFAGSQRRLDGDHAVYPMSLLFRAGDYEDKQYAMTPDEIASAVAKFTPCGGNIEHTGFLAGRACKVRRIWGEGDVLRGEVAVPVGLDALLTDDERKLSCEWDRPTKTLSGMALCMKPRVSDAALMSELAGGDADALAEALVAFAATRQKGSAAGGNGPQDAPKGAKEQGMPETPTVKTPSRAERFFTWLNGGEDASFAEPPAAKENVPPVAVVPSAESEKIKALEAQIAALQDTGVATQASAFADGEIAAGRAVPAERAGLVAAFREAAADDRAVPRTVTFAGADGKEATGSRVDALRANHAARSPHGLTQEALANGGGGTLANPADTTAPVKMSDERKKRLMAHTGISMVAGK